MVTSVLQKLTLPMSAAQDRKAHEKVQQPLRRVLGIDGGVDSAVPVSVPYATLEEPRHTL
ncbi:MAG: hypothetical protein AAF530_11315 [Pseudomonadota bacterium]